MCACSRYIRLKTFICLVVGTVAFVMLYLLNVPFAGLFGFITFVLNFIPNVSATSQAVYPHILHVTFTG
jgi:predicted PurR-regulated permease PerM